MQALLLFEYLQAQLARQSFWKMSEVLNVPSEEPLTVLGSRLVEGIQHDCRIEWRPALGRSGELLNSFALPPTLKRHLETTGFDDADASNTSTTQQSLRTVIFSLSASHKSSSDPGRGDNDTQNVPLGFDFPWFGAGIHRRRHLAAKENL